MKFVDWLFVIGIVGLTVVIVELIVLFATGHARAGIY
jgi:hypothetical protein